MAEIVPTEEAPGGWSWVVEGVGLTKDLQQLCFLFLFFLVALDVGPVILINDLINVFFSSGVCSGIIFVLGVATACPPTFQITQDIHCSKDLQRTNPQDAFMINQKFMMGDPTIVRFLCPPFWKLEQPRVDYNGASGTVQINNYVKGPWAGLADQFHFQPAERS